MQYVLCCITGNSLYSLILFHKYCWSLQVRAGDIVIVENREFFPADLILLKSRLVMVIQVRGAVILLYCSDPDGRCYVQTASLDGETNLKIRLAHSFTADYKGRLSDLQVCIPYPTLLANLMLYNYVRGKLTVNHPTDDCTSFWAICR